MITEDHRQGNDSSANVSVHDEGDAGNNQEGLTFPHVGGFPAVTSHNMNTYRTHNVSGFFDSKPIVDKAIHGPSKILSRKWRDQDMNTHKKKLSEIRGGATNYPKTQGGPIINKGKNEQILEERYTEIERENRLLFEKITHIHLKGGGVVPMNQSLQGHGSHKRMSSIMNTAAAKAAESGAPSTLDLKIVKDRLRH